MPAPASYGRRAPARPLKSPLAVADQHARVRDVGSPERDGPVPHVAVLTDREATLAEFEDYLRTVNNRDRRPYQDKTIEAYVLPGKNLDRWLTAKEIDGDFTLADTALLNKYFREYHQEHGQGGTHTLQRNLIQLFNFLQRERGHPTPYTDGLNRYAEVKGRPKTLGAEFVEDLLEVTGGGRARDFETSRDHAIIRILRSEGIRRAELLGMVMHALPADVIKNPVMRLVPLKGARAVGSRRTAAGPRGNHGPGRCGRTRRTASRRSPAHDPLGHDRRLAPPEKHAHATTTQSATKSDTTCTVSKHDGTQADVIRSDDDGRHPPTACRRRPCRHRFRSHPSVPAACIAGRRVRGTTVHPH